MSLFEAAQAKVPALPCVTPGCQYHIHDSPGRVEIAVDLPEGVSLKSDQHEVLHLYTQIAVAAALLADGQIDRVDLNAMALLIKLCDA